MNGERGGSMLVSDPVLLLIVVGFSAACAAYVAGCERL